ncbi:hypothetical protein ACIQI7_08870 [Kitasatospora sp. NPDC092039]|uniref:hypothetical protein n=1 Tax=Kitasatospora sp. NPDC092039 TaxID=3364086 RepID=UPI003828F647
MASIVVLYELDPADGLASDDGEPVVVAVHAAGADPDVPQDPLPGTLCGLGSAEMEHSHYQGGYGQPWYPPALSELRCRECERALRAL